MNEIEEYAIDCVESHPGSFEEALACFKPIYSSEEDEEILKNIFFIYNENYDCEDIECPICGI
jgi:hypothetical protein